MAEEFNLEAVRSAFSQREQAKREAARRRNQQALSLDPDQAVAPMPPYRFVKEVWSSYIIVEDESGKGSRFVKIPFTVDAKGAVKFGTEKRVKQTYVELSHEAREWVDLVSSRVYPSLERKPGGPDNWVEATGGLPKYIERIAKHLHYEKGYPISRAIATAVNTVKRWARKGTVTKSGTKKLVTAKTQAQAAAAVAQWEAKKARARADLAARASFEDQLIDLAKAKWGHNFVPKNAEARKQKAKRSKIAAKRVNRLYGPGTKEHREAMIDRRRRETRSSKYPDKSGQKSVQIRAKGGKERVSDVAQSRRADVKDTKATQRVNLRGKEHKRGGGQTQRANRPWNEIPESEKVVRNGKRYVLTIFGGKRQLTEWHGENPGQEAPDQYKRVLRSITTARANQMTTAQIRRLLKVPGQPASVKKILNKVLAAKVEEKRKSA